VRKLSAFPGDDEGEEGGEGRGGGPNRLVERDCTPEKVMQGKGRRGKGRGEPYEPGMPGKRPFSWKIIGDFEVQRRDVILSTAACFLTQAGAGTDQSCTR